MKITTIDKRPNSFQKNVMIESFLLSKVALTDEGALSISIELQTKIRIKYSKTSMLNFNRVVSVVNVNL